MRFPSVEEIFRDIYVEPGEEARELALRYGYLPYMVERYIMMLGRDGAIQLLDSFEKPVKPVVRTNTVLIRPGELKKRLEKLGFRVREVEWAPGSFRVIETPSSPTIGSTHEYLKGYYYVHRDVSSLLPVLLLLHNFTGDVLDACAAPGGKATFMAQILAEKGNGVVYANDLVLRRLRTLVGHAMRLRLSNIVVLWSDARKLPRLLQGRLFKRALLDAPCSGEGRIMVDPGRKTRTTVLDLAILAKREIELLYSILDLVEPGGIVAYSTCSIAPEENEYVVTKLMELREDVEIIDPPIRLFNYSPWLTEYGKHVFPGELSRCIRMWPHIQGSFGFTTCLLRRVG